MKNIIEDKVREKRIVWEIVVDAYDSGERAMGWYYYLEEQLVFPFNAECIAERIISPLRKGDRVEVIEMPPEEECEKEIFVTIKWQKRNLAVPLSQLVGIEIDDETNQGIQDWHYWKKRGYAF